MTSTAWRFPDAPLRARAIRVLAVAMVCLLAVAWMARETFDLSPVYQWRACLVFAAMSGLALGAAGANHPFARFGPANIVTTIRAAFVALVAAMLWEPVTVPVAWAVTLGTLLTVVLDGVDGWFARRTGMASGFGARFDMETDALLILVLSATAWHHGKAGTWVIAGGLLRYLFVAAGWIRPWMAQPLSPTRRGRMVAVAHMIGLMIVIAPFVAYPWSAAVAGLSLAILCWSFAVDVGRLHRTRHTSAERATLSR